MKLLEIHERIKKIVKLIEFHVRITTNKLWKSYNLHENTENHENYKIACESKLNH